MNTVSVEDNFVQLHASAKNLDSEFPLAIARLERGGQGSYRWCVDRCPIADCQVGRRGRAHYHGGGPLSGDPTSFLGHRAHVDCRGYILVDGSPRKTAELIAQVRKSSERRSI